MKPILKTSFAFIILVLLTIVAFNLYARFLFDYSLEKLALAVKVTGQNADAVDPLSRNVYEQIVQDLASEEAVRDQVDYENLTLLELASRSIDESSESLSLKKAHLYLRQVIKNKQAKRIFLLKALDAFYELANQVLKKFQSLVVYFRKKISDFGSDEKKSVEFSSVLLLNQADHLIEQGKVDGAVLIYEDYITKYPDQPETGFVKIALSNFYIRGNEFDKAETILEGLRQNRPGTEEAAVALTMLSKLDRVNESKKMAGALKTEIANTRDAGNKAKLGLKLGVSYLEAMNVDDAQAEFETLAASTDAEISRKAKFYLSRIFKLKKEYGKSVLMLVDLLKEKDLESGMAIGLQAGLADNYYKQGDTQKSLKEYEKISTVMRGQSAGEKTQLKEIWYALAELERSSIANFDNVTKQNTFGEGQLFASGLSGGITAEFKNLGAELVSSQNVRARDRAFQALESGKVHTALDLFERDLRNHSSDSFTLGGLATIYMLMGDRIKSLSFANRAYKNRSDEYTASVLAYLHALENHYDQAERLYEEAVGKRPDYIPAKFNLASLYLKSGKVQDGLGLLARLEHEIGDSKTLIRAKILNNIGYAYWLLGDQERAREKFRQALAISPNFLVTKTNLDQLTVGESLEMDLVNLRES